MDIMTTFVACIGYKKSVPSLAFVKSLITPRFFATPKRKKDHEKSEKELGVLLPVHKILISAIDRIFGKTKKQP
jgi:hypothetical protein